MPLLKDNRFLCIDCEFTGLDPEKDRIIEIAAVRFTFSQTLDQYETLVDPEGPITEEALQIHHISPHMLIGQPKVRDVLPHLVNFMQNDLVVGHGIGYDLEMLSREAQRVSLPYASLKDRPIIDTLRLARHYGDSPNNSLEQLAAHFNVPHEGAHRAMNDVMMNIEIFKHLVRRYRTVEEIMNILAHPIKMKYMPLGKYRGRMFSEIPLQYLLRASQMEFDQDLMFTIRNELKKRKQGNTFSQATNPFANL